MASRHRPVAEDALRASADTLERRIRREHEFAANASHQLRTPITAVRLELEDLSLWRETPPAVRDQLDHAIKEIDRLADAIAQLLQMARGDALDAGPAEPLDEMIRDAVDRWTPEANSTSRRIFLARIDSDLGTAPAATSQILDVLLHNALKPCSSAIQSSAAPPPARASGSRSRRSSPSPSAATCCSRAARPPRSR